MEDDFADVVARGCRLCGRANHLPRQFVMGRRIDAKWHRDDDAFGQSFYLVSGRQLFPLF